MTKKPTKRSRTNRKNPHEAGRRQTVSLCTIVKNEQQFIEQCLHSVKNVVDEIVLVDTGSTDDTIKIAERLGAKVYHHQWQDSFSEARNYALQFATCDWILHLDADEVLEQDDLQLLRTTLQETNADSIFVPIINYLPDECTSKFYYRRLFRRTKGHYEGIVHNQLVVDGTHDYAEIRIHHYGYNLSPEKMQAKYERSEKLLQKAIKSKPDDVFSRFNLARIYRNQGHWQKCIDEGMQALTYQPQKTTPSTYLMLLFDVAYSHMMLQNFERAEKLCCEGLTFHADNLDLTYTLANVLAKRNRFREAIKQYRRFLDIVTHMKKDPRFNLTTLIIDTWAFENKALYNIGQCLAELEEYEEAEKLFKKAIDENPKDVAFYKGLSFVYLKQNRLTDGAAILATAVQMGIDDGFVLFKMAEIHRELGDYEKALQLYDQALRKDGEKAEILNAMANVFLILGNIEKAKEQFIRTLKIEPHHIGALYNLIQISSASDDPKIVQKCTDKLLSIPIDNHTVYVQVGDLFVRKKMYKSAIEFYERYLKTRPNDFIAITNLASCYARLGHFASAQMGYQAALALNPKYETAQKNLGLLKNLTPKN